MPVDNARMKTFQIFAKSAAKGACLALALVAALIGLAVLMRLPNEPADSVGMLYFVSAFMVIFYAPLVLAAGALGGLIYRLCKGHPDLEAYYADSRQTDEASPPDVREA